MNSLQLLALQKRLAFDFLSSFWNTYHLDYALVKALIPDVFYAFWKDDIFQLLLDLQYRLTLLIQQHVRHYNCIASVSRKLCTTGDAASGRDCWVFIFRILATVSEMTNSLFFNFNDACIHAVVLGVGFVPPKFILLLVH